MRRRYLPAVFAWSVAAGASCGGPSEQTEAQHAKKSDLVVEGVEDKGRCDFKGRNDREVVQSRGPGAFVPNIRRVFGIVGEGDDRRRILLCREVDTNLDGVKDVVRTYNEKGETLQEQADSNYDGKIDTWLRFARGRIAKGEIDSDHNGRPDEVHFYMRGKLSRVQRDSNGDGRPDIWEIYADGVLNRMGVDLDYDGHVDRWDRDELARREAEIKQRQEEARREDAAKKPAEQDGGSAQPAKSGAPAIQPPSGAKEAPTLKAAAPKPATSAAPNPSSTAAPAGSASAPKEPAKER
jgi:hypothetical protein